MIIQCLNDNSDTYASTGETYNFNITVTDNIDITYVSLEYWFGNGTHENISMIGDKDFSRSISIPINSVTSLKYFFYALDTALSL